MSEFVFAGLMFPALFFLIFLGLPVAYSLMAVAFAFGLPFFGERLGIQLFGRMTESATSYALSAIPLFILMGTILERSKVAKRLFEAMQIWVGRWPGGLCIAALAMCAIFAASTGVFGAVEVVIGMMAIPIMRARKYNDSLVAGTICAGGSLGTIIPPSVSVVVYATIADLSVGDMFAGILLPGLLMTALFIVYVLGRCILRPQDGPPVDKDAYSSMSIGVKLRKTAAGLLPAMLLIIAVLGSILNGLASPTEAAAIGVVGAVVLTAAYGELNRAMLLEAFRKTVSLNAVIMLILVAGTLFSSIFIVNGGRSLVTSVIDALSLPPWGIIFLFLFILFVLGFVIDWVSMLLVCIPIFNPVVMSLGFSPLWFGVLVAIVIQTSYLTPPMAPAVFYYRTIAPPDVSLGQMFRGVAPFVVVELIVLVLVMTFPNLALWLPKVFFGAGP